MNKIVLEVTEQSRLKFFLELLLQFDYINILETSGIPEYLEDLALSKAIDEGKDSGTAKREDIFKILNGEHLKATNHDSRIPEKV